MKKGKMYKNDEILTVKEAAEYLKVSKGTIWRWARSGQLPAFKIGRNWRIGKKDINAVKEQQLKKHEKHY